MKYHIGDTVSIRKNLKAGKRYGGYCLLDVCEKYFGKIAKITGENDGLYVLDIDSGDSAWTDEMLDPVKKTLFNLVEGDKVEDKYGEMMVLGVSGRVYHMSGYNNFNVTGADYTAEQLEEYGYKIVGQTEDDTIDVLGKTYKKSDVEERLAELEEV